jgi:hypothetical protein
MADPRTSQPARRARKERPGEPVKPSLEFHRKNLYLMGLAALSVGLGYVFLGVRLLDLGSILLVVGYLVLFPVAVMVK